jgi:uncharacterized protein
MENKVVDNLVNNADAGPMQYSNTATKFATFIALALTGFCMFSLLGLLLIIPITGINLITNPTALSNMNDTKTLDALKIFQLANQLGLFVFPALVAAYLFGGNVIIYLKLSKLPSTKTVVITITLMVLALPAINLLGYINSKMQLPSFMQDIELWMRTKEVEAEMITKLFLKTNSITGLIVNMFIVALMAAIGEEFFFRGVIQRLLIAKYIKPAIAIWITAIIFSAIHMQFFGFFPRMIIGALLGFLFLWSNNLWVPILAHFTNNASAVLMSYASQRGVINESTEQIGATQNDYILGLASLIATSGILFFVRKELKFKTIL